MEKQKIRPSEYETAVGEYVYYIKNLKDSQNSVNNYDLRYRLGSELGDPEIYVDDTVGNHKVLNALESVEGVKFKSALNETDKNLVNIIRKSLAIDEKLGFSILDELHPVESKKYSKLSEKHKKYELSKKILEKKDYESMKALYLEQVKGSIYLETHARYLAGLPKESLERTYATIHLRLEEDFKKEFFTKKDKEIKIKTKKLQDYLIHLMSNMNERERVNLAFNVHNTNKTTEAQKKAQKEQN